MDEPSLNAQNTDVSDARGEMGAPRSCARTIPLGVSGCATSRMRLPPLIKVIQSRKKGPVAKVAVSVNYIFILMTEKFQITVALHP